MESGGVDKTDAVIWHNQMFGRLRVRCLLPATPVVIERFQTQKTALLWALLVGQGATSDASMPLYRDDLAARLWPDAAPQSARDRLSQALSWLRRNFEANIGLAGGQVIQADRRTVGLAYGIVSSDAAQMDALLKAERASERSNHKENLKRSALLLRQAIALYDGPLLPGVAEEDDLLLLERQRFEVVFQSAARRLVVVSAEMGEGAQAIEYARRLLRIDPENENDCALLMRLLFRTGDANAALRAYGDFAARLAPNHLAPPPTLTRLMNEIKERSASAAAPSAPPSPTPPPAASPIFAAPALATPQISTCLPLPLTRYFGREQELDVLASALQSRQSRLVTLLGPGGSGKTRLAIEAARRFAEQSAEADISADAGLERAAFFVTLENIHSPEQIMPAVLRALQQAQAGDVGEGGTRADGPTLGAAVARLLAPFAPALLVLDNAESVAGEAATTTAIADLLARAPSLSIIATSRARLGVDGEQQLFVSPLPSPHQALPGVDAEGATQEGDALLLYPSVRLFLDRARHARLGFALSDENRDIIAALCARLEGMPLAIELCAAWATTLSPPEMLAALDDRFDLLVSRRADVPPRHRSLYAAIESSYLQLPPDLKAAFALLSVFRGGWTAAAARAMIADDVSDAKEAGARVRNTLAALQERSLVFTEPLPGTNGAMRWRMLETLREFAWSQLSPGERIRAASRHAAFVLQFAEASGRQPTNLEPRQWLDTLEIEQDNFQAALAAWRSQAVVPDVSASEAIRDVGFTPGTGSAAPRSSEGISMTFASFADSPIIRGVRLCVALDRFWLTRGYSRVASDHLAWFLPRLQDAVFVQSSGAAADKAADTDKSDINDLDTENTGKAKTLLLARGYTAFGRAFAAQGNLPAALAPLESALETWRGAGDAAGTAGAQMDLGEVCYWLGRKDHALALLHESEAAARRLDDALLCGAVLLTLGSIALDEQDIARAEGLHLEALEFARRRDNRRLMARVLCNLAEISREQGHLETARQRCEEALKAAEVGDQAAQCYIRLSLGRIACAAREPGRATERLGECLRYAVKTGTRRQMILCLLLAAQIADLEGQAERCALLLGAGSARRDENSLRLIQGEADEEAALIAASRQTLGDAAYEAAFAHGLTLAPDAVASFALNHIEVPA